MKHIFPDAFRNPPTSVLGSYSEPWPEYSNDGVVVDPLATWAALGRDLLARSTARVNYYTSDAAEDVLTAVTEALDEIEAALREVAP